MLSTTDYFKSKAIRKCDVIDNYADILKNVFNMNKSESEEYQQAALEELLCFVYENNEYYRQNIDAAGFSQDLKFSQENFEKLRYTLKDDLSINKNLLLSVQEDKVAQVHTSTGTSGAENIYMKYTLFDLYGGDLIPSFGDLFKLKETDVVAIGLPYEMSSSAQSFHRVTQIGIGASVIPIGKGGAYSDPQKAIKLIKELNCNILITTPSYMYELYKAANEASIDIPKDINLDAIWLTGEGCSDAYRKRIENRWNTIAKFYYGSLEAGVLGIECDTKDGYHIPPSHVYVEIINPDTGKVLENGEVGEIVVTTLLREGTPLIRYRTQDLGYIEQETCECGSELLKLYLRGRKADQIHLNGEGYAPIYLEELLMQIPEVGDNYRLDIYNDYIDVVIELNKETPYFEGVEEVISSKFEFNSGIPNKITVVDTIPYAGTKAKRVNYIREEVK